MQFFKSTFVAILAFSAYATAAALPEPKAQCGDVDNSCDVDNPCCLGRECVFPLGVVSGSKHGMLGVTSTDSVWQCVLSPPPPSQPPMI
jgi:hypothetical protein